MDLLDIPTELLSARELAKLLLKAYMMGVEDYGKGELKGKSTQELKSFIEPKIKKMIL